MTRKQTGIGDLVKNLAINSFQNMPQNGNSSAQFPILPTSIATQNIKIYARLYDTNHSKITNHRKRIGLCSVWYTYTF